MSRAKESEGEPSECARACVCVVCVSVCVCVCVCDKEPQLPVVFLRDNITSACVFFIEVIFITRTPWLAFKIKSKGPVCIEAH